MTITFSVDDVVTLKSGDVWRVSSVRTHNAGADGATARVTQPGDDPYRVVVGLDDPANPGKHGTAFTAAVLKTLTVQHDKADRAAVIGNLTADLMSFGELGPGLAESIARHLINLGWRR